MAKQKNYNNYTEVVGNVANIYQNVENGDMRFTLAAHRRFTKKDGTKGEKTQFLSVCVVSGRRYAKQDAVAVGSFLRVIGHLENNAYQDKEGNWKGGMEIQADKITVLKDRGNGTVENTETGEVETLEPAAEE